MYLIKLLVKSLSFLFLSKNDTIVNGGYVNSTSYAYSELFVIFKFPKYKSGIFGHSQIILDNSILPCKIENSNSFIIGTPGPCGFWDQSRANSALYSAFWSAEQTDFKNVIVENIHWALFEDAEVAEVKRPRNSKRRKFYYEKW